MRELHRHYSKDIPSIVESTKELFSHSKLIGRDDHARFESFQGMSESERYEMEFMKLN